jgi:hypothetical protein
MTLAESYRRYAAQMASLHADEPEPPFDLTHEACFYLGAATAIKLLDAGANAAVLWSEARAKAEVEATRWRSRLGERPWVCEQACCGQTNVGWATQCGRCNAGRPK